MIYFILICLILNAFALQLDLTRHIRIKTFILQLLKKSKGIGEVALHYRILWDLDESEWYLKKNFHIILSELRKDNKIKVKEDNGTRLWELNH